MAITLDDPKTEVLAHRLSALTGEEVGDAVRLALEERLRREERLRDRDARIARLKAIVEEHNRLPVVDPRTPDEIIGYDEFGLP